MIKQIVFSLTLLFAVAIFSYSVRRIIRLFRLTKPAFPVRNFRERFAVTLNVAFGQSKIFRLPVIGSLHALVFWGFCVILFGSIEMIIDGIFNTGHSLKFMGHFYDLVIASGDIFSLVVTISIVVFLIRRLFLHVERFEGIEMKRISHLDANFALILILFLMISLTIMNASYYLMQIVSDTPVVGIYPVGMIIAKMMRNFSFGALTVIYETSWWIHILLIFLFANILPYSKHFHVFMSVPNVFLSRLDPLGKLPAMDHVTTEVKLMLDPDSAGMTPSGDHNFMRFGVKDCEDINWKNYLDSLACTQCGRCTAVCPANLTGKKLSPRKIMMDVRARMKEKGPGLIRNGKGFDDHKSLIRDYISEEELWACTTCQACAQECPININHPTLIVDLRRYLVMEEGSAPGGLKTSFSYMENNGAPWQFSPEDRMSWAKDVKYTLMADCHARGKKPEYLFWVGCAGAFDDRYKKVTLAFAKILSYLKVDYAVLGKEESCTGDPARRAGNEMLYLMQAFHNIELFKSYEIKKILTICPHCYNIFKNDYPDIGGHYEVINYLQFLEENIHKEKLKIDSSVLKNVTVTFHDPCYLGRANQIYDEPRKVLGALTNNIVEMKRNKSFALCCGGGGGQMFKEAEEGTREVYIERTEEALTTEAQVIATACPFCMNMLTDGLKSKNKEVEVKNYDIAELVAESLNL